MSHLSGMASLQPKNDAVIDFLFKVSARFAEFEKEIQKKQEVAEIASEKLQRLEAAMNDLNN